jgi:hypothetical protein
MFQALQKLKQSGKQTFPYYGFETQLKFIEEIFKN